MSELYIVLFLFSQEKLRLFTTKYFRKENTIDTQRVPNAYWLILDDNQKNLTTPTPTLLTILLKILGSVCWNMHRKIK